ncbi:MAG TPA: RHS repeat-associated core domain-containing protein [Patescibacteria group bacterium]|nr:RHS repeat-associated core domain-containing protein [Patescibacteria group bacterium]
MIHDASHSYAYDAENRITQVDGGATATYSYDADGQRIQKNAGGTITNYVYGLSGEVLVEYGNCQTCAKVGYMYLNGALVAFYGANGSSTTFVAADHLGSTRIATGYPTPSVVECDDYYPFGELISCGSGTSVTTHKFTGKERDAESGNDYFGARYYASSYGRFMSPDWSKNPEGVPYADYSNPQSLNLYDYTLDNPETNVDLDGHGCPPDCLDLGAPILIAPSNRTIGGIIILAGAALGGPEVVAATTTLTGTAGAVGTAVTTLGIAGGIAKGTADIVAGSTGISPKVIQNANDAVTSVTNPTAAAASLATKSMQEGSQIADLATAAKAGANLAAGKGLPDPADAAASLGGATAAIGTFINRVGSTISGALVHTPPPPPPPSPCAVKVCG